MRGDISARGYRLHRAESGDRHPGHPGRYGAGSLIPRGGHNISGAVLANIYARSANNKEAE